VSFQVADGAQFLRSARPGQFDLIYADAWPGKFSDLDDALALLRPGGIYVIDDLLPQPNWPEGHAPKVPALIHDIERRAGFATVRLAWASGLMLVVRRAGPFARPDFSGEWALDRPASALEGGAASVRSATLTIEHREPVFRCQGAFAFDAPEGGPEGPQPQSTFEYSLERITDGREIVDDEQRASASWDGDTLVLLDETGKGDAAVTMSWRYQLDGSGRRLTATERMRGAGRDQDNVWVFQRR
jgi:hypothetical protein